MTTTEQAHHYFAQHGSRDAVLALLGGVKCGKHTVEEAAEVLWALMDARVGSVTHDLANIMRAMRDGRSTIHWRADESAATALIRERDQLAAQVAELHKQSRYGWERAAEKDCAYGEALRERHEVREALKKMLLSRDAAWTGGHDWQEAIEEALAALGIERGVDG
jgi:hypothetical protein